MCECVFWLPIPSLLPSISYSELSLFLFLSSIIMKRRRRKAKACLFFSKMVDRAKGGFHETLPLGIEKGMMRRNRHRR